MKQSILEEPHKGFCIQRLCWSSDGSKLFSVDTDGTVLMTHVDFHNVILY